jgi:porphobilinogen deaminase
MPAMAETSGPDGDPMDLDTAVAVLRGTVPWPITAADMEKATAIVLAELHRLRRDEKAIRKLLDDNAVPVVDEDVLMGVAHLVGERNAARILRGLDGG